MDELLTLNCKFEPNDYLSVTKHVSGAIEIITRQDYEICSVVLTDNQIKELINTLQLGVSK